MDENQKTKISQGCGTGFIIFFALIVLMVGIAVASGGEKSSSNKEPNDLEVMTYAQTVVKDFLKSPSSAVFPKRTSDYDIVKTGLRYKITGTVEAANAFGVMIQSEFVIIIEFTDTAYINYVVKSLYIDNQQYV